MDNNNNVVTKQVTSGTKVEAIGTVKTVVGEVKAIDPSGNERILQAGDKVYPNETIMTAVGALVLIEFVNGTQLDLPSSSQIVLDTDVFDPSLAKAAVGELTAEQIQEMIARGEDPTAITEATAAGAGAGDEGGSSFIVVDFNNAQGQVTSGFNTLGIPGPESTTFTELPPVEDEPAPVVPPVAPPVVPNISVSVGVGVDVGGEPGGGDDVTIIPGGVVIPNTGVTAVSIPELTSGSAGAPGFHPVTFVITLDQVSTTPVTITYTIVGAGATQGTDYTDGTYTGVVTIPAGTQGFTVTMFIVEDSLPEGNEDFTIVLSNPIGATLVNDTATVTIIDDDVTLDPEDAVGDETNGLQTLNGNLNANFGPGDTGSFVLSAAGATWSSDTNTLAADDESWTLVVNSDGTYTFTQLAPFAHPDETNPDDPLSIEVTAVATDSADNVSSPAVFTITVNDDGPTAVDDTAGTAEDTAVTVNVLANDAAGADGGKALVSAALLTAGAGTVSVNTVTGELTFTPAAGFEGVAVIDYVMQDAEGDPATASLSVTVSADSEPTVDWLLAAGEDGVVDEGALLGGNLGGTTTTGGTLDIATGGDTLNAVGGVVINGIDVTNGGTVLGTYGDLTVSVTGGVYSWIYTLDDNAPHTGTDQTGPADQYNEDVFAVVVTDDDGDSSAVADLTIKINDDGPTAVDDTAGTAEDTAVTVNVLANDAAGADGGKALVSAALLTAGAGAVSVNTVTGELTFTPAAGFAGVAVIDYVMQDAEGDPATASLSVTVAPDSTPTVDWLLAAGEDGVVDEGALLGGNLGGTTTTGGTLDIATGGDTLNAVGGVVINGVDVTNGGTVLGTYGDLTVSVTGGVYSWVYTLDDNAPHTGTDQTGPADQYNEDVFAVVVTDDDGDSSAAADLTIKINDDGPVLDVQDLDVYRAVGVTSGEYEFLAGADGGAVDAGSLQWTNLSDFGDYAFALKSGTTSTYAATYDDNGVTKTFFEITINDDGTYDFNLVNPAPSTVVNTTNLFSVLTPVDLDGNGSTEAAVIADTNFGGAFKLVLTGSSDDGATYGGATVLTKSATDIGVDGNSVQESQDERMKLDVVRNAGFESVTLASLTVLISSTGSISAGDKVDLKVAYEDGSSSTVQVSYDNSGQLVFEIDSTKPVDYVELIPVSKNVTLKITGFEVGYTSTIDPADNPLDFSVTGVDGDVDSASATFTVDLLAGTAGNDVITTGANADTVSSGAGNDTINAGAGNDIIVGGEGDDTLTGGLGADTFVWNAGNTGADAVTDFTTGQGDVLNVADLLTGGMVMTAVAESGHLQLQFSDGGAVVQTIDLNNLAVANNTEATNLMNQLLTDGNIVD